MSEVMHGIYNARALKNAIFVGATRAALTVCVLVLAALLLAIIMAGAKAISWEFLTQPARDFGASGGIVFQIIGTLLMGVTATLIVLPFATGLALARTQYIKSPRAAATIDLAMLSLNAIPSIAFGLFGLILFVNILGTGLSWFVGSLILAMMMLPTVSLAAVAAMQSLPSGYRDNGYALGLTKGEVITKIVLPQSTHGIITGVMIALARAVGETAPIMFIATAFSGVGIPSSLNMPVSALPTHILALAQQATNPDALAKAWGASLTLLALVAAFSALAYYARMRLNPLSTR